MTHKRNRLDGFENHNMTTPTNKTNPTETTRRFNQKPKRFTGKRRTMDSESQNRPEILSELNPKKQKKAYKKRVALTHNRNRLPQEQPSTQVVKEMPVYIKAKPQPKQTTAKAQTTKRGNINPAPQQQANQQATQQYLNSQMNTKRKLLV